MNIIATSDLHGRLLKVPKYIQASNVDLVILAGDIEPTYPKNMDLASDYFHMGGFRKIDAKAEAQDQTEWTKATLLPWINKRIKPTRIISVNGNHTFLDCEEIYELGCSPTSKVKNIEVEGVKIGLLAGSMPFTGEWSDEQPESEMENRIAMLDPDIEILVSHVPPSGILDKATDFGGDRIGCRSLAKAIFGSSFDKDGPYFKKLRHHFFGHCHEGGRLGGEEEQEVDGRVINFHNCSERLVEVEY